MADGEDDLLVGQRVYACELIQQMGIMLRLPQVAISSAQIMFHRFYARRSMRRFDVRHIAIGALFLACKVEECPRKVRDVLNCFCHLCDKRGGKKPTPVDMYSNAYVNLREKLIRAERELLKELGFILYAEHPHKFILNYVKLLSPTKDKEPLLAQSAWNFINDSQRTDVCMKYAPEVICCAAIWFAARTLRIKLPSQTTPPWWELFDAKKEDMDAVCNKVTALYSRPRARFVKLEAPPDPVQPEAEADKSGADEAPSAALGPSAKVACTSSAPTCPNTKNVASESEEFRPNIESTVCAGAGTTGMDPSVTTPLMSEDPSKRIDGRMEQQHSERREDSAKKSETTDREAMRDDEAIDGERRERVSGAGDKRERARGEDDRRGRRDGDEDRDWEKRRRRDDYDRKDDRRDDRNHYDRRDRRDFDRRDRRDDRRDERRDYYKR